MQDNFKTNLAPTVLKPPVSHTTKHSFISLAVQLPINFKLLSDMQILRRLLKPTFNNAVNGVNPRWIQSTGQLTATLYNAGSTIGYG